MRIHRTLPPAASPIYPADIFYGMKALFAGKNELDKFCDEIKEFFGVKHCFLLSSGKTALTVILKALRAMNPERNEVLIPAYTCYSVPSAITRAGLKVKLCDIDPHTLDYDYEKLSQVLNENTNQINYSNQLSAKSHENGGECTAFSAILSIHLFGIPSDTPRVMELVKDPHVTIIEDAAQAMGGIGQNLRKLGTTGYAGFFSLGRGKAFSAVEGGVLITNRDDLEEKIGEEMHNIPAWSFFQVLGLIFKALALAVFLHPLLFWLPKRIPQLRLGETIYDPTFAMRRMSPFQAGLSRNWKEKLQKFQSVRSKNSKKYMSMPAHPELSSVRDQPSAAVPAESLIRYPLIIKDDNLRVHILKESEKKGLGIMPGYPDSINHIRELQDRFENEGYPGAEKTARTLVTLPIHPFVKERDIKKIIQLIADKNKSS